MAQRHYHEHRSKKTMAIGGIFGKIIENASPIVQFIQQITEKDLAHINANLPAGTTIDTMDQLKNMTNIVISKMSGFNPFKDAYQGTFKLNPAGIINKWTLLDAGMIAYGEAGKHFKFLPKAAYIGRIGKKSLPAAVVGGLLDTPTSKTPSGNTVNFRSIPSLGSNQQQGIVSPQGLRSSSSASYTMVLN